MPGKAIYPVSEGIPYSATLAHFGEFLVFSLLLYRALASGKNPRNALVLTIIIGFAYSILTESLQNYVPGRVFSLPDILTNDIGTIAGLSKNIFNRTSFDS